MNKLESAKDAIKQAKQAGYNPSFRITPCEIEGIEVYHVGDTLLDPLFWQALGKARGWSEYDDVAHGNWDEPMTITHEAVLSWKLWGFRWFETRMSGGSEEIFWQNLP